MTHVTQPPDAILFLHSDSIAFLQWGGGYWHCEGIRLAYFGPIELINDILFALYTTSANLVFDCNTLLF